MCRPSGHPSRRASPCPGNATDVHDWRACAGADASCAISPLSSAARAVTAGAREAGVERVIIVPGAGSLDVARVRLLEARSLPDAHEKAEETTEAMLALLLAGTGFEWTVLNPGDEISEGERTGRYRTTSDALLPDAQGKSVISSEDYAMALMDDLERTRRAPSRFGVVH